MGGASDGLAIATGRGLLADFGTCGDVRRGGLRVGRNCRGGNWGSFRELAGEARPQMARVRDGFFASAARELASRVLARGDLARPHMGRVRDGFFALAARELASLVLARCDLARPQMARVRDGFFASAARGLASGVLALRDLARRGNDPCDLARRGIALRDLARRGIAPCDLARRGVGRRVVAGRALGPRELARCLRIRRAVVVCGRGGTGFRLRPIRRGLRRVLCGDWRSRSGGRARRIPVTEWTRCRGTSRAGERAPTTAFRFGSR